jgi:23S rRNA pseudouridine1911/1915/1917 synthase
MNVSNIDERVLYEDNHLLIINKLPSEIVQGDKTGDEPLSEKLKAYIKNKYHKPGEVFLGVVHRLDRPVSGALIFARTSKSLSRLNELLKNGQIRKRYWAVVKNAPDPESAHLVNHLSRDEAKNKSFVHSEKSGQTCLAELNYSLIGKSKDYFLLEIDLITGRHHQIRAQLAHIGCPIKGDLKYGFPRSNPGGFIHLHARNISFIHPVRKEQLEITAPPPDDPIWNYFASTQQALPDD